MQGDPPRLDLPPLANKFAFGASSMPHALPVGGRDSAALNFALSYAHELAYPSKELKAGGEVGGFEDLKYRRRPGMAPSQTVPAPLYFRQAAAHHSPALLPSSPPRLPALLPSSPPRLSFSPRVSPARPPSISGANISAFALPPSRDGPSLPPSPVQTDSPKPRLQGRRSSWTPSTADLLMSPRIRALRAEDPNAIEEQTDQDEDPEAHQSSFARYLFAHASGTATPALDLDDADAADDERDDRGRVHKTPLPAPVPQRSVSADSVPVRTPSIGTARPTRFLFSRGGAQEPELAPLDDAATPIQFSKAPMRAIPGNLISATVSSTPSSVAPSPMPSPPASPPTLANRGRSATRRPASPSPHDLDGVLTLDPRGRSKLRGLGAVKRSLSPTRDASASASRGRQSDASHERGRRDSRSSARGAASDEREDARGRGRSSRREEEIEEAVEEESDDEQERGRGRGRTRSRSRSLIRRGRGHEIAISGPGYGHSP